MQLKKYIGKSNRDGTNKMELLNVGKKENNKLDTKNTRKTNILLVDDHPENLLALESVLMSPNYNLVRANSGEEALRCLLKQNFAVILLDVQMPGLNGFETAKLIKEREKSKLIPIIFITAISQSVEHVYHGYSVGAVDYIFKPFYPATLKLKVQEFVKIYQNQEQIKVDSEFELKEVNEKLNRTSFHLRKHEELARVIGETLMDSIITCNVAGDILSVNPSTMDMFGYSLTELLSQHISQLLPQINYQSTQHHPSMVESLRKNSGRVLETNAIHKNGVNFPVDIQIGEASIEEEHFFVCSIRDISERKKIEEERKQQYKVLEKLVEERTRELQLTNQRLRKEIDERKKVTEDLRLSQERFHKIFESSPCLIAMRSLKDGRYMDMNASWLNYTGYSYEEVRNQISDLLNVTVNSDKEKHTCIREKEESIRNVRIHYQSKAGEVRDGLLSTEVIEIHGEKCILNVITDITERVRLERELTRLDRLHLIGEMAAGIAHEIRNPMTTVRGFLELSKLRREQISYEHIDLMLEEVNRANSIITEFLNLARNKVNNMRVQHLNPIVEALFPLIQAEALLSDKWVVLELGECPELYLDEKEIRQLILNLALNGLESMSSGGSLTIKTYTKAQAVVLEVQDQGSGIKSELIEKIGTPFFTTKDIGTGLGLAICYSVVNRHNALIDFKTSDQGTIFSIIFNI
ncbi:PAS domain S-box protein [Ammoniphilus sp. 3BR4]|uniref:PAS domain S-box protein n=1 Tax=Ammoniphilus sp. 3BR4 TaxID=3158265 RepID=UPI003467C813